MAGFVLILTHHTCAWFVWAIILAHFGDKIKMISPTVYFDFSVNSFRSIFERITLTITRLFEKFVSKSFQGTGVGLYISKNIVGHGGLYVKTSMHQLHMMATITLEDCNRDDIQNT